jgi:23S rRNA (guanine745-N1)-methyltransferase
MGEEQEVATQTNRISRAAALAGVAGRLRCPHCGARLTLADRMLACGEGHSYDVARQGYVSLLGPGGQVAAGDSQEMVDARSAFLGAGHYEPIARAVSAAARRAIEVPGSGRCGCVVELGAGTGYHLAAVLGDLPGWQGLALDTSRAALRRAVGGDRRIAGVVCDAWRRLPVGDGAADVVLSVFAPRNAPEIARILSARGRVVMVTPAPEHLGELVSRLGLISVDPDKPARLRANLGGHLRAVSAESVEFEMTLDHAGVRAVAAMGPSAHHIDRDTLGQRISGLPDEVRVTGSVIVQTFCREAPD